MPKFPQERQKQRSDGSNFSEDKIDCTKNAAIKLVTRRAKELGELRKGGDFQPN